MNTLNYNKELFNNNVESVINDVLASKSKINDNNIIDKDNYNIKFVINNIRTNSNTIDNTIDNNNNTKELIKNVDNNKDKDFKINGEFIVAHKEDINNIENIYFSKIKKPIDIDLIKGFKRLFLLILISVICHDIFRYYERYKASSNINITDCFNKYNYNNCEETLNSNISEVSPYLLYVCKTLKTCLDYNYFTFSNFIMDISDKMLKQFYINFFNISLLYSNISLYNSINFLILASILYFLFKYS